MARLSRRWDARRASSQAPSRRDELLAMAARADTVVTTEAEAEFPCSADRAWEALATSSESAFDPTVFGIEMPGPPIDQVGHRFGTVRPAEGAGLRATIREVVAVQPGRFWQTRNLTTVGEGGFEVHVVPLAPERCRVRLVARDNVTSTNAAFPARQVEHLRRILGQQFVELVDASPPLHLAEAMSRWETGRAERDEAERAAIPRDLVSLRVGATVTVAASPPEAWLIARDPATQALNGWAFDGAVFVVPGDPRRGVLERWAVERMSAIDTPFVVAVELVEEAPGRRIVFRAGSPSERWTTTLVIDDSTGPTSIAIHTDLVVRSGQAERAREFWQRVAENYAQLLGRRIDGAADAP
jgi:hypothetical protein